MSFASNSLLNCFCAEASELLDTLARGCLNLEKSAYEASLFDELNRAAHSLKGAARLVELFDVSTLAHTLEDTFAGMSRRQTEPSRDEVTKLLESVDELKRLVEVGLAAKNGDPIAETPTNPACSREHETETAPPPRSPDEPSTDSGSTSPAKPEQHDPVRKRPAGHTYTCGTTVVDGFARVSTQTLTEISRCASEVLELYGRMARLGADISSMRKLSLAAAHEIEAAERVERSGGENRSRQAAVRQGRCEKVKASELRGLGEALSRDADRLLGSAKPLSMRLHRLALDAQTDAVDDLSSRFERIVRDAAGDLDRHVEFVVIGGDVRVDRHVLQRLMDPISHLLRNAVAHGIEPADVRAQQNKRAEGCIRLSFEKHTHALRVVVEDDGVGLNPEAIRRAARDGTQAGADFERSAAHDDVSELIFRPGLTTAAHASQVSGRGVGLDIVRTAVERLHGSVSVVSEPGQFCRFTIEVPSHLDVTNVFVVRVAGQDLLVPLSSVVRTCVAERSEIIIHGGRSALVVAGQPVRLVQLHALLGWNAPAEEPERRQIAVLDVGRQRLAIEVESLRGKWRAVIKGAGPVLGSSQVVAGAAIMSDGRPAFLLKPDTLVRLADGGQHLVLANRSSAPVRRKVVLVVDDSLTTRMLEKAVLEAAGYRVVMACDGAEAMACIAREELDLAVIDFEMPGLNGPELARVIREQFTYQELPLIMLTSRSSDEDRRRGLAAGFQAYLVKGQFEQASFLNTVRGLIGETEADQ